MGGSSGVQEESGKELGKEVSKAQKALTSEEQEESPRTVSRLAEADCQGSKAEREVVGSKGNAKRQGSGVHGEPSSSREPKV